MTERYGARSAGTVHVARTAFRDTLLASSPRAPGGCGHGGGPKVRVVVPPSGPESVSAPPDEVGGMAPPRR